MSITIFDTQYMSQPDTAMGKEYLLTNGAGAYSASTIGGCNTRKYHGLLVAPQPLIDDNDHVIVSAIDEEVVYKGQSFALATHQYPDTLHPQGFKFIQQFQASPTPKWVFQLGNCVFIKEILMPENEDVVMIRYTVAEAEGKIDLKLTPFLAFRKTNELKRANALAGRKEENIINGIKVQLYDLYGEASIQTSLKSDFIGAPDWYYNIEYLRERDRGYDHAEDLYVAGYFNLSLKKGDKVVVYAGLQECNPKTLNSRFTNLLAKQPNLENNENILTHAANQFVIKSGRDVRIKAGFHWFGNWGRDTFISMPGLLLTTGKLKEFTEIINSWLPDLKYGLLPNVGRGETAAYNSADASLWFIWAIQKYVIFTGRQADIWSLYCSYFIEILENYRDGTRYGIKMDNDGLINTTQEGVALTWMDAMVAGKPVTPRTGKAVDINALWYNAICFCMEVATLAGDTDFTTHWGDYPTKIRQTFMGVFWDKDMAYLADCVYNGIADWSLRPNQVFALSMPYSPVPDYLRKSILEVIKDELLTPKGLRTLSPRDKHYKGKCEGNQEVRDSAYHQGTVWPWLTGHFVEAYIREYGSNVQQETDKILNDFEQLIGNPCINTIPEIYNGDYPHKPVGAVAQAWSVAELLRAKQCADEFKEQEILYKTVLI